jgi:hypothetical protein
MSEVPRSEGSIDSESLGGLLICEGVFDVSSRLTNSLGLPFVLYHVNVAKEGTGKVPLEKHVSFTRVDVIQDDLGDCVAFAPANCTLGLCCHWVTLS